jgi:hypothetical protein
MGADCKSAGYAYAGSNPARPILQEKERFKPFFFNAFRYIDNVLNVFKNTQKSLNAV